MPRKTLEEANHGRDRFKRRQAGGIADYAAMDGAKLVKVLEQLCDWGCAIRFGKTKDGGAYALGVYGVDDVPYTEFLPPGEDPVAYLLELAEWMEATPGGAHFPATR